MNLTTSLFEPETETNGTLRRDIATIVGLFVLLSAVYWAGVFLVCGQAGFPLDDSYIHLQFARNLYETGQMAFNRGVPSSGCTAPLLPLLIAAMYGLVRNWYLASWLVGGLSSLGTALVVYGLVRTWTTSRDLAHWGAILTVVTSPTIIQAYCGMESGTYSLLFLLGLWFYGPTPQRRLIATLIFAICIWLRPEFLIMLPIVAVERWLAACRKHRRWLAALGPFLREIAPHLLIWGILAALYAGYHWQLDRHFVPNTFRAKAVASWALRPAWLEGLPAALKRGNLTYIFLAIFVWPTLVLITTGLVLGINCAPLSFGLRESLLANWRDDGPAAAARRLALLSLIGYPWLRGLVDSTGFALSQFQRYYAHLTPLMILLVIGAWPTTGAIVQRRFWNWQSVPRKLQQRRTIIWAFVGTLGVGLQAILAVGNINTMQVTLGHWVKENTRPDQLVATNDIGAIGFISERPILDTAGLIEPPLVDHYLAGGDTLSYLQRRNPAWVIIFPNWYPELSARTDLLETVRSVTLKRNVICGGSTMVVYRPKWPEARHTLESSVEQDCRPK